MLEHFVKFDLYADYMCVNLFSNIITHAPSRHSLFHYATDDMSFMCI